MRGIATRVGVAPNAVYTYFPDKAAVVRAIVERLLGEVAGADSAQRTWPSPVTTYFVEVISGSPIGPRACSFWVEMPISAPKPNSPPSVNRVEALTMHRGRVDRGGEPAGGGLRAR